MIGTANRSDRHRVTGSAWEAPVTIRLADGADLGAIAAVAERDSRRVPPGPPLVAERGGAIAAVLSLSTGEVVADPFIRTAELVNLLRYTARTGR